jgi:hypothetical protein
MTKSTAEMMRPLARNGEAEEPVNKPALRKPVSIFNDPEEAIRLLLKFDMPKHSGAKVREAEKTRIDAMGAREVKRLYAQTLRGELDEIESKLGIVNREIETGPDGASLMPYRDELVSAQTEARDRLLAAEEETRPKPAPQPDRREGSRYDVYRDELGPDDHRQLRDFLLRSARDKIRFVDARVSLGKLKPGQYADALEETRRDQDEILDSWLKAKRAQIPVDEVLGEMRREFEGMANRGRPDFAPAFRMRRTTGYSKTTRPGKIKLPMQQFSDFNITNVISVEMGMSFCVWMLGVDRCMEKIEEELRPLVGESLTAKERAATISTCKVDLLANMRREERIVCSMIEEGQEVERRKARLHLAFLEIAPADDSADFG